MHLVCHCAGLFRVMISYILMSLIHLQAISLLISVWTSWKLQFPAASCSNWMEYYCKWPPKNLATLNHSFMFSLDLKSLLSSFERELIVTKKSLRCKEWSLGYPRIVVLCFQKQSNIHSLEWSVFSSVNIHKLLAFTQTLQNGILKFLSFTDFWWKWR